MTDDFDVKEIFKACDIALIHQKELEVFLKEKLKDLVNLSQKRLNQHLVFRESFNEQ